MREKTGRCKTERIGKFSAKAWIGELVGYSVDTPGYRLWDPTTHKVWDVRAPDFDESMGGGWWTKPAVDKKPIWEGDEPLELVYAVDPPVDPPVSFMFTVNTDGPTASVIMSAPIDFVLTSNNLIHPFVTRCRMKCHFAKICLLRP